MKKGDGYSAPAIAGDRLILFHRVGDEEVVDCLRTTDGRRFWRFSYPTAYHDRYGYNHGPRCSPVISGDAVFTFGAAGKLHCLDLQTGAVRWQRDILKDYKLAQNFFGVGSTPLVEGDKLIVNVGADSGPCVVAFDVRTGKQVWRPAPNGGRVTPRRSRQLSTASGACSYLPAARAGHRRAGCCASIRRPAKWLSRFRGVARGSSRSTPRPRGDRQSGVHLRVLRRGRRAAQRAGQWRLPAWSGRTRNSARTS